MVDSDPSDSSQSPEVHKTEFIAIATVGRAVGLNGWCRIVTFGSTLENVKIPYTISAGLKKPEVSVTLIELRKDAKGYKGLFAGYDTREEVESLKNRQLFFEREKLPITRENEFYHFELEGMEVFNTGNNEYVGKVEHIYNYPTVDALEVRKADGSKFIIPMSQQAIEKIDKESKKIFVNESAIEELL